MNPNRILVVMLLLIVGTMAKSKVFIVVVNPEPKSFCVAIADTCAKALQADGHEVKISNLYQLKMFNRIDRTDFTEQYDPTYFRPQVEQREANLKNGATFVEELRRERNNIIWADVLIYVYPAYFMYVPGILQSYMERVFSYGFAFGPKNLAGKKAMLIYTTGSPKEHIKDPEEKMLFLLHDRFSYTKMSTIPPYGAYAVGTVELEVRLRYLKEISERMHNID